MNINGIDYKLVECAKCNHQWLSKIDPKKCPKCFRYDPWLRKSERNENIIRFKKEAKYPIQHLQVGDSTVLPWQSDERGKPDFKKNESMNRAVLQEERRKGKKFRREGIGAGLKVTRLS